MVSLFITFPKEPANDERLVPTIEHYKENLDNREFFVYKVGTALPSKVSRGDKCYIGFDNKVQGYMRFLEARYVTGEEAKSFGHWDGSDGNFIFCEFDSFEELPDKPSYNEGFPGFRYYEDEVERGNIQ